DELFLRGAELSHRLPVQRDDRSVLAADHEKRGGAHGWKGISSQVRATAARNDGLDDFGALRSGDQSGCRTSTRPEISDRQVCGLTLMSYPVGGADQPLSQQINVEPEMGRLDVHSLLFGREQVNEQGSQACFAKGLRDRAVSRAMSTAAATVRKQ